MEQIRAELTQIHGAMAGRSNWSRCVITRAGNFQATSSFSLWEMIPTSLFTLFATAAVKAQNREAWDYFADTFGRQRIVTICERSGIDFDAKERHGLPLTRRDLSLIFLHLGALQVDDVHNLFDSIIAAQPAPEWGVVTREAHAALHGEFQGTRFDQLTHEDYRALHPFLVPTEEAATLFFDGVPDFNRVFTDSEEKDFKRGIYLAEQVWRSRWPVDRDVWREWMVKVWARRQQGTSGTLIPHPEGVYAIHGHYDTPTADVCFLRPVTPKLPHIIKFEGLGLAPSPDGVRAMRSSVEGAMGEEGRDRVAPVINFMLGRSAERPAEFDGFYAGLPPEEFRPRRRQPVHALAYSMGTSTAMQVLRAHPGIFQSFTCLGSPGVPRAHCDEFARRGNDGPMVVTHIYNIGDPITQMEPVFGVGVPATTGKIVRLVAFGPPGMTPQALEQAVTRPAPPPANWIGRTIAFFKGFLGPHQQETTLRYDELFSMHVWTNETADGRRVLDLALGPHAWAGVRHDIQDLVGTHDDGAGAAAAQA